MDDLGKRLDMNKAADFWKSKTVWLTSKWSGVAGMDISVNLWRDCLERLGCDVVVRSYSFTEWSAPAQRMLAKMPTEHLFSDINAQHPEGLTQQLIRRQSMIREDLIRALSNPAMKSTDRALLKRMHT